MYYFSLFTLLTLSCSDVILFFPDYYNSFFPLFLDIQTIMIFLPSYSILFYGLFVHLIKNKLRKNAFFRNSLVSKLIIYLYISVVSTTLLYI